MIPTADPATDRWRPSRAGLVSLWRYWDETFTFHNGRLLLRGPNGSGKSMALELLLPFVLDGDSSPSRLTSSGRNRGRLFDRLMTGTDEPTRTGFAWVEFTRGSEVFTVGARIRGSRSTNRTDVDLFTTTQSVGRDLHLLDETRGALSRRALGEALGERGRIHSNAEEHRAAVREVLFPGFSGERYDSVIGALLSLRREKLSERLDPDKLSEVLSEALPPLDDHDVAAVAEGFERLDRRRSDLATLAADADEVRQLARRQRSYARAVVLAEAGQVRSAETTRDDVTRREREARDNLAAADEQVGRLSTELADVRRTESDLGIGIQALKERDAYTQGAGLTDLAGQARRLREIAVDARQQADRMATASTIAAQDAALARSDREQAAGNVELAATEFNTAAQAVSAGAVAAEATGAGNPDEAENLIRAWVRGRTAEIGKVRAALGRHDDAVTRRDVLDDQVSRAEQEEQHRQSALAEASRDENAARSAYAEDVRSWAAGCETVGTDRVRAVLPMPPDDPAAVRAAITGLDRDLAAEDAMARTRVATAAESVVAQRSTWLAERERWASSAVIPPEPPRWRSDRTGRPGAPLWQLVEVAPDLPSEHLDGLEAALTAAGLVDAWVSPDGALDLGPDRADIQLTTRPVREGAALTAALRPTDSPEVPAGVIDAVLASIPLVDSVLGRETADIAVATDGSYRLGSALGRGAIASGTLLGVVARERYRLVKLVEIDATIADLDRQLAELDGQVADLDRRRAAITAEFAARPSGRHVVAAARAAVEAATRLDETQRGLDRIRATRRSAEDAVRSALRELTTLAARVGLPTDLAGLEEVTNALAGLTTTAATWCRRRRELGTTDRQLERADRKAEQAAEDAEQAAASAARADDEAHQVQTRHAELEASIGADFRELTERISEMDAERVRCRRRDGVLDSQLAGLREQLGEMRGTVTKAAADRAQADSDRDTAHGRFRRALVALGADSRLRPGGTLDTSTAVLAAARSMAAEHEGLDTSAATIERHSGGVGERVHKARAALGARVDIDRELGEDSWWTLTAVAAGLRRPVGDLAEMLARQLDEGRAELAAEEERLFEQTLAGSVRRALVDRIRQANALVKRINQQLETVRTAAAAVGVRLQWSVDPDQPPAVQSARALLLRDPADLTDQERSALHDFVRARVDQARAELEANAPWEARLKETLDYRSWHRFGLQIAHRDWDGYQPATGPRLQKLSTGERSMVLHLPMIASVAAHYTGDDGRPGSSPRLILLDELFAGVDVANRAQLFGTFSTWELDGMFTSDHEWCQYSDLDGIAIHYLHPPTDSEPVTSTRFTWDGYRRELDPVQ